MRAHQGPCSGPSPGSGGPSAAGRHGAVHRRCGARPTPPSAADPPHWSARPGPGSGGPRWTTSGRKVAACRGGRGRDQPGREGQKVGREQDRRKDISGIVIDNGVQRSDDTSSDGFTDNERVVELHLISDGGWSQGNLSVDDSLRNTTVPLVRNIRTTRLVMRVTQVSDSS